MRWPWVSRELLERVEETLLRTEDERRLLLERILSVNGMGPVAAVVTEAPDDDAVASTAAASLTISGLRAMAEEAAYRRAGRRRDQ